MAGSTLKLIVDVDIPGVEGLTKVSAELDNIEGAASKTGSTMTGVFQGIGQSIASFGIGLVTSGISAAVDQIGNSITLASDKAEAASKVNVLFGESADIVTEASKDAATSVGLSSGAYLAAAGDLGNLTTNLGFTGEEAANMSVEMLALAADMGSFNNASTEEVTEAMGAAFRGETEPIRRFGVMLDDASVKAKAMEMGLYSGVGAIDKSAKASATYALILEQTTAAQGDFARTSDGLANTQKISAARMEDAWTRVGEVLAPIAAEILPLIADAIVGLIDIIMDIAAAIGEWVDDNAALVAELEKLGGMIADYVVWAFGVWMEIIGELGYRLGALIGIIIDILGAIIDFGDAIVRALSGDFEGAAAAAERGLDRIGSFAENVQRVMGDTGRRAADEAAIMGHEAEQVAEDTNANIEAAQRASYAAMAAAAANGGQTVGTALGTGTKAGIATSGVGAYFALRMESDIRAVELTSLAHARKLGEGIPGEIGKGMASESQRVRSGAEALRDILKNGLTPEQQAMEAMGAKYVKLVRTGMDSEIPGARQTAQEVAIAAINTIEDAGLTGAKGTRGLRAIGIYYDELLASGLTAAEAKAALAAGGVSDATLNRLDDGATDAHRYGENIGEAWARGIVAGIEGRRQWVNQHLNSFGDPMRGQSPPKVGPLKDIDKWGENIGAAWATGITKGAGEAVLKVPTPIGPLGLTATPGAWPGAGAGAGGSVYQITVQAGVGDPVAIGREVVDMIGHFERANGREWRA